MQTAYLEWELLMASLSIKLLCYLAMGYIQNVDILFVNSHYVGCDGMSTKGMSSPGALKVSELRSSGDVCRQCPVAP